MLVSDLAPAGKKSLQNADKTEDPTRLPDLPVKFCMSIDISFKTTYFPRNNRRKFGPKHLDETGAHVLVRIYSALTQSTPKLNSFTPSLYLYYYQTQAPPPKSLR